MHCKLHSAHSLVCVLESRLLSWPAAAAQEKEEGNVEIIWFEQIGQPDEDYYGGEVSGGDCLGPGHGGDGEGAEHAEADDRRGSL